MLERQLTFFKLAALPLVLGLSSTGFADTLAAVKKRGVLNCGVSQGLPGFSATGNKGKWTGMDVDVCRAVAAAIFNNPDKVKFVPLNAKERFTALQSGEVDLLSRNTTWTQSRDGKLGIDFVGVTYYDGQGFMVRKKLGVKSAKELNGASVCTNLGTTTELNVTDYFRSLGMKLKLVSFEKSDEVVRAYDNGRCDVYTTDQSGLYANRIKLKKPDDHMVLPEIISKEPLGPAVRHGDNKWGDLVRWTLYALVAAEELGITQKNVAKMAKSKNPEIKRILGTEGELGSYLGLKKDWAMQAIKAVGNYGEVFERNVGKNTTLKISRGQNALWTKGGLQYAMPFR